MSALAPIAFSSLVAPLLRPPGQGIPTFSAGKGAGAGLLSAYAEALGRGRDLPIERCEQLWKERLEPASLRRAAVAMLGVPLDTGAGIRRGAAYGPRAVRQAMLARAEVRDWLESGVLVDLGDVYVNPHLLSDDMLSDEQRAQCQDAMYASVEPALRRRLPVSALSQTSRLLQCLLAEYPQLRLFVVGGDHSVGWPVTEALVARHGARELGIVQPDAHTDLLPSRLGVRICFGTWSFHANELIGRGGKLVQLGIRQSGRDKAHWESTCDVVQHWASDLLGRIERGQTSAVLDEIVDGLHRAGVRKLYFSNDIDGTDERWASATGTPASGGLPPEFFLQAIERLSEAFELVGADVVEVAPDLGTDAQREQTCALAADYACAELRGLLRGASRGP